MFPFEANLFHRISTVHPPKNGPLLKAEHILHLDWQQQQADRMDDQGNEN